MLTATPLKRKTPMAQPLQQTQVIQETVDQALLAHIKLT